ncbi:hypothetical protein F0L17_14560 [Streptomyces sp. TRM43335]|uniref:Uncharacterized protein n=2 Tax=Streptomyces taklimakanensis TaxID=2569853 RepID=A0A6G2BDF8_9ACTN|nr:hypothetical protein [Streptomyces taklimakanensis]
MPQTTEPTATTWPEGVIARYLTVGGATVDISQKPNSTAATATCRGCTRDHYDTFTCKVTPETQRAMALIVGKWAQSHAETCRALPRPTA